MLPSKGTPSTSYLPVEQNKHGSPILGKEAEDEQLEYEWRALRRIDKGVFVRLFILGLYLLQSIIVLIWAKYSPKTEGNYRVIRTGSLPVDQFYSGLVLAVMFAPGAIVARMLSFDLQSLHPFSIASRQRVALSDLDRMMDFGLWSAVTTSRYSPWYGGVQLYTMLIGAVLVPLGTLTITTGSYVPPTPGVAVVGLPTMDSSAMQILSKSMGYNGSDPFYPSLDSTDTFLPLLANAMKGAPLNRQLPPRLRSDIIGPGETMNISFMSETRYDGIVTFGWASNCRQATDDDVAYKITRLNDSSLFINVTWADGTTSEGKLADRPLLGTVVSDHWGKTRLPAGGSLYTLQTSMKNFTLPPSWSTNTPSVSEYNDQGVWISRLRCTPTMTWQVSSCVWDGLRMGDCLPLPQGNTTDLDTTGLDALHLYFTAVLTKLFIENGSTTQFMSFLLLTTSQIAGFDTVFEIMAHEMARIVMSGIFGTATVPTTGEPSKQVYMVREPILSAVVAMLALLVVLVSAHFVWMKSQRVPTRKIGFLTLASSIRGSWWGQEFSDSDVASVDELRKRHAATVMYGTYSLEGRRRVGLAPVVASTKMNQI